MCLDERNAVQIQNDTKIYKGEKLENIPDDGNCAGIGTKITISNNQEFNFHRYYDLVKPKSDLPVVTEHTTIKEEPSKTTTK